MFGFYGMPHAVSGPVPDSGEGEKPEVPGRDGRGGRTATPLSWLRMGSSSGEGSTPERRPGLKETLLERGAFDLRKAADVIYAVDRSTGMRCGLFYGDPEIEFLPIDPDRPFTWPAIVDYRVDREIDNLDSLAGAVELVKGSCCFVGDLRKRLKEPWLLEDLRIADIVYAVDSWSGERCGLFYGDPETESLPIYDQQPWKAPAVLEITVNHWSDDLEVLAEAVRSIKGFCCYPPDEVETGGAGVRSDPEIP
jgi:hypothetical protein